VDYALFFNADQAGGEQTIYLDDISYIYEKDLKKAERKLFSVLRLLRRRIAGQSLYPSGWMPATAAKDLKLDVKWKTFLSAGKTCIRVEYQNKSGTGWAGIFWQQPANNWGTVPRRVLT